MITFDQLQFLDNDTGAWCDYAPDAEDVQAWVPLPNGFCVSVVRNQLSSGGKEGCYEMGVYKADHWDGMGEWKPCHIDAWGDQVKGWLRQGTVERELDYIASL